MFNGFDMYTVDCAIEAETHIKCDIYASDVDTLVCPVPNNAHAPVLWLHNGAIIIGGGRNGYFYLWNNQGHLLQKYRHGSTRLLDITVREHL